MPFSSGTFSLFTPGNPVVTGTTIASTWCNNTLNDLATGLSTCLLKDGSQTVTANIPMSSFLFTGIGSGLAARTRSANIADVQDGTTQWVAAGGTADVITATYSPALTALIDGQVCRFRASVANATTTPTFSPNGLTAHTITKRGGAALVAGDIPASLSECIVIYNLANTRWELAGPTVPNFKVVSFTRDTSVASGTQAVTGVGFKPGAVIFIALKDTTVQASIGVNDTATAGGIAAAGNISADTWAALSGNSIKLIAGVGTDYAGTISSMDSDGFTVTWTKTGSPSGVATITAICFR